MYATFSRCTAKYTKSSLLLGLQGERKKKVPMSNTNITHDENTILLFYTVNKEK